MLLEIKRITKKYKKQQQSNLRFYILVPSNIQTQPVVYLEKWINRLNKLHFLLPKYCVKISELIVLQL